MQASRVRGRFSVLVALVLAFTGLQTFLLAAPAQASVSAKISSFPYVQNWDSLTGTSTWADFPGVEGFTTAASIIASNQPNSTDVGSLTAEGTLTSALTHRTGNTPNTDSNGGILAYANATNKTVALSATGTFTTPLMVFHLDTTGQSGLNVAYDIQDLDSSAVDDQPTRVALQYRVGTSGPYTNIPAGQVADATVVNNAAVVSTSVSAALPAAAENQANVFVRIITIDNASGSNEHIGIDNITITSGVAGTLTATNPGNKTFTQNQAITPFNMAATGGTSPYTWSDPGSTLPAGLSVNSAGQVSGTPTATGTTAVTLQVTDSAAPTPATDDVTFDITVNAPSALTATSPGAKSGVQGTPITGFNLAATGGNPPYSWSATGLPPGVTVAANGAVSGTPSASGVYNPVVTVTDSTAPTPATDDETFTFTISAAAGQKTIAEIQGTGARSSFAPASGTGNGPTDVTTEGVVTAVTKRGYNTAGDPTCGFCGFTIQTAGTGSGTDLTPGASDAVFVWGGNGFTGLNSAGGTITIGDSVRVTGRVAEFGSTNTAQDTNSLTQITYTNASAVVPVTPALAAVTPQTTLPTVYADREAHESELFAPTDVVVTDTFNFETFGELGIATGNQVLTQPTEICADDDTACITTAQTDIKNRGYFLEDSSNTSYLTSSTYYRPNQSNNSDIPLPFMDATHSVRIGAKVTYPIGGVLEFRNRKWYLNPPRAVMSTPNGVPDLGTGAIEFEDTRPADLQPADVGGDLKLATYNVENYFNTTGAAFAAANPYYNCGSDFDRDGNPVSVFECTAPQAIPNAWDPVTNAPTGYSQGLVSAPRGAWRQQDLDRQTAKIVTAINGLGADIVSLQELGNPNKLRLGVTNGPLNPDPNKVDSGFGTPIAWRDEAIDYLVDALNAEAGAGTWAFVASPEESTDATSVPQMCATTQANGTPVPGPAATAGTCSWASGQDVIRSGFIYKRATVVPVGASDLDLPNSSAPVPSPFDNAREPLAQFFKPVGHPNSDGFAVIANHFKSKGDSDPAATGGNANSPLVGAFNLSRTNQAKELLRFANEFAAKWNTDKVFLVGDINSYSMEDPILAILNDPLNTLGFTKLESDDPNDTSYMFSHTPDDPTVTGEPAYGARGSLDHVFASAGAAAMVEGVDIWEINANESSAFNFGRYNTNATLFLNENDPFAGSDHNPEIIGINIPGAPSVRDIQIIGSNDFHGRLVASSSDGGAAQLSGAVKSLKDVYGPANSIFVAAGDLIGASTFESFIAKDKPTLEALNAAGLEISAIGNHEFDQGVDDLVNRVMKPYDATTNPDGIPGGLDWEYIGANVSWTTDPDAGGPIQVGDPVVIPRAVKDFGDGIKVGFVGAVTEDLPNLVAPSALDGVTVSPIASAVNTQANLLVAEGADVIVLLVHEGAPSTNCATMQTSDTAFADLLGDLAPNIDAVISGHTHLEYSCSFTVPEWAGDPITKRPVLSAGQYGVALDQLVYSFDTTTGQPVAVTANNVGVKGPGSTLFSYPEDPAVKSIVDDAVADAVGPGSVVLGKINGAFKRARLADGVTENRGGESTLGNLVAEIQRAQTPAGGPIEAADIAFMNPGGLRDDMLGTGATFPKDVSYRAAAAIQPFANTLVNMDMTGAQIKAVLEQQWQRDPQGNVPSRPFLRLGTSKGFTYTYTEGPDPLKPGATKGTVTSMWLNGERVTDAGVYSVTMNSFLAGGGDNFRAFLDGADKRDTGLTDLQAQVDYFAANAAPTPLPVDYGQRAVKVTFPGGAPAEYGEGDTVAFDLASLAMTGVDDVKDTEVKVRLNGVDVATGIPVTNTVGSTPFDNAGTASVSFALPAGVPGGEQKLRVIGNNSGTEVIVPIQVEVVEPATRDIQILGTNDFHGRISKDPTSASAGAGVLAGAVKQLRNENPDTVFAAAGDLIGATTFESFILNDKPTIDALNEAGLEVSSVGNHEFDQGYDDLVNRVMAAYDEDTNPDGGAEWAYLGANVRFKANDNPALPATWTKDFGAVRVGFVGTVTEHLPELVAPAGIEDIKVTDIVAETNAAADDLVNNQDADLVIMLVHEGAPGTNCTTMDDDPASDFGSIITGVNDNVDAIISGHTHLEYNCAFPVPGWSTRPVTERPVVSSGQYGSALNKLVFTVDTATGEVQAKAQSVVRLKTCSAGTNCGGSGQPAWVEAFGIDGPTQTLVEAAEAEALPLGQAPLGQIAGPIRRGYLANGTTENRGVESSLGNLVAEAQRWQTSAPEAGGAQIAFMNPGGLRADMLGTGAGGDPYPRTLTYKQAANVQPFANGLVNMDLTGAKIKEALEQQWQPGGASRPFLKLGASAGFTYTSDPDATAGNRITGMWLDGTPIDLAATYSVTVNGFLSSGGDNFTAFRAGTNKFEAGLTDLQGMVNYMAEFANTSAGDPPLPVPAKQNGVHVNFPASPPAAYPSATNVAFDVSGWSYTSAPVDSTIAVKIGATTIGTAPVDNTVQAALPGFDATGTAAVNAKIPATTPVGPVTLLLTGPTTGTEIRVPITVSEGQEVTAGDVSITYGQQAQLSATVAGNQGTPAGTIEFREGATSLGTPVALVAGDPGTATASLTQAARALGAGTHTITAVYDAQAPYVDGTVDFTLTVAKAAVTVTAEDKTVPVGTDTTIAVDVTSPGAGTDVTGTVEIFDGATSLGSAPLTGGQADVPVDSDSLPVGPKTLTARYATTTNFLAGEDELVLTVTKAASTVSVPNVSMTYGKPATATASVTPASATGSVTFRRGATVLGVAPVAGGQASLTLPARSLAPGSYGITAEYSGNATLTTASDTFTVTVAKASSTTSVKISPKQVKRDKTKAKVVITVTAAGVVPGGQVKVKAKGQKAVTVTLNASGKATVKLDTFGSLGKKNVKVKYLGSAFVLPSSAKTSIKVIS